MKVYMGFIVFVEGFITYQLPHPTHGPAAGGLGLVVNIRFMESLAFMEGLQRVCRGCVVLWKPEIR